MKRIAVLLTAVLLAGVVAGCGSSTQKDSWAKIKKQGYFVLGLDDSFPPMGFRNKQGELVGFDIDLAKAVAKRMGLKVKLKPCEWKGIIPSLNNGVIDVIWNGLTVTDKRREKINFTPVYLNNRQVVVVRAGSGVKTPADLKGKVAGLQMGSTSEKAFNSSSLSKDVKELKKYSNNTEALMDLSAGRLDAVVVDEIVGRYYIAKKPGKFRVLERDLGKEAYAVGLRKQDSVFLRELAKALDAVKKDGTADRISVKWFGEAIVVK